MYVFMLGFVVITAVTMKSMVFWVATRCSSEKAGRIAFIFGVEE
jgi:hypothetical protein